MIKLTQQCTVRECTAPFTIRNEKGQAETVDIRVRYFSHSIAQKRELGNKINALVAASSDPEREKRRPVFLSDTLPLIVESLPDIAGLDGKPIVVKLNAKGDPTPQTMANFEAITAENLEAIDRAINEDLRPKDQPQT